MAATAAPTVPIKKSVFVDEVLDNDELGRKYVYALAEKNSTIGNVFDGRTQRQIREQPYRKYNNLLMTCFINWDGSDGKPKGKRMLRYYEGCTTLFADEQPQDKYVLDALIEQTQRRVFNEGYLEIYGYERMLKKYMDWCSYNRDSPYRTPVAPAIFYMLDAESDGKSKTSEMDLLDEVAQLAKDAKDSKMVIHCRFLGVSEYDLHSGAKLSMKTLRADYREFARNNPKIFKESFYDNSIEIKYWIQQALANGKISTTAVPNKAIWADSREEICAITGLKSMNAIAEKIYDETQSSQQAEDFVLQLKALN